ncbi:hypothetical protein BV20DRAFT_967089 [Pilatotrama ljubarskyi]|nr:hypothetical protein BV20DRAFT_967089 [Pilatotrama ljubarskyi]
MDGCKKVFAREADLKRHQRTTKTHSIPGFQCPQCDATFTRTDALRRHQKSRHNGVVIEPSDEKGKHSGDGASSGSRSPSPGGTPARSHGEGSTNGSPSAAQTSSAGPSNGPSSYYRPHTMQDGGSTYYAGYPPPPRPPPPGMMIDPHYPPPPIGLPTSATRSHQANWQPPPPAPTWPDGHPLPPPPGMYMPSYYPSPYYRHPGMPMPPHPGQFPPQINPDLLSQSNGVMAPESALRNTSPEKPEGSSAGRPGQGGADGAEGSVESSAMDTREGESIRSTQSQSGVAENGVDEGPDESTLMAAAALQAVLAFQREQQEAASRRASAAPDAPAPASAPAAPLPESQPLSDTEPVQMPVVPVNSSSDPAVDGAPKAELQETPIVQNVAEPVSSARVDDPAKASANGDSAGTTDGDLQINAQSSEAEVEVKTDVNAPPQPMEQLMTEDGMPMLNPAELLTQESLASPPLS